MCARIETYHPSDSENCTFVVYVNRTLDAIQLQQDDVYAANADNVNKVYELPIYSFAISGTQITNLQKLIGAVEDYAKIKTIVDNALATAQTAMTNAANAVKTSDAANTTAQAANNKADNAVATANAANNTASAANSKADGAVATVAEQHAEMTAEIAELEKAIVAGQGSTVKRNGEVLAIYDVANVVETTDEIIIEGGGV